MPMMRPIETRAAFGEIMRERVETGGAGKAVNHRRAIEQHARSERAEDEILQARFGRADVVTMESGNDIEREALQFERDIERDEIVRRDHHHHAGRGEQHQHGIFRPRDAFALVVLHGEDQGGRRADQHHHLRRKRRSRRRRTARRARPGAPVRGCEAAQRPARKQRPSPPPPARRFRARPCRPGKRRG